MYYRVVKEYYDNLSNVYENLYREEQTRKIIKILDYIPEGRVLDVGAGTGILEEFLDRDFYLLDISEGMIEVARRKFGEKYKYFVSNAISLPFKEEFFDCVVSVSMLQDVKLEHIPIFVSEMERVLRGGGTLIVTFVYKDNYVKVFRESLRKAVKIKEFRDEREFYWIGQKVYKMDEGSVKNTVKEDGKGEQAKKRIAAILAKG